MHFITYALFALCPLVALAEFTTYVADTVLPPVGKTRCNTVNGTVNDGTQVTYELRINPGPARANTAPWPFNAQLCNAVRASLTSANLDWDVAANDKNPGWCTPLLVQDGNNLNQPWGGYYLRFAFGVHGDGPDINKLMSIYFPQQGNTQAYGTVDGVNCAGRAVHTN